MKISRTAMTADMSSMLVVDNGSTPISDRTYIAPNGSMINEPVCCAARMSVEREEISTLEPMLNRHARGAKSNSWIAILLLGK